MGEILLLKYFKPWVDTMYVQNAELIDLIDLI